MWGSTGARREVGSLLCRWPGFRNTICLCQGLSGSFCAGAGGFVGGVAAYTTWPIGEARMPSNAGLSLPPIGYFKNADPDDPLIAPVKHLMCWRSSLLP